MTRRELKIRAQQIIDAIPVLREKEYGWTEIETMLNEILIELDDNPWQTGTPTEEGWYLCQLYNDGNWYKHDLYKADYFSIIDGKPCWSNYADWDEYPLVAWQKITPYEEKKK